MDLEKKLDEAIPTRNMKEKEGLPESEEFDYTRKHAAYREIAKDETDSIVRFISKKLNKAIKSRLAQHSGEAVPFHVCSIGCGDGERDRDIIKKCDLSVPISYVGIEINAKSCSRAKANLGVLPSVEVTLLNKDFMQTDLDCQPKFDFVYMSHSHYYIEDVQAMFLKLLQLTEGDGKVVIITQTLTPPHRLENIIFEKEWGFALRHFQDLVQILDEMGVRYTTEPMTNGVWHMDRCFKENFTSEFAKDVLDFFSQSNLKQYSQEVTDLCIQYLKACCRKISETSYVCDFSNAAIIL